MEDILESVQLGMALFRMDSYGLSYRRRNGMHVTDTDVSAVVEK